jgi:hypothetical protein
MARITLTGSRLFNAKPDHLGKEIVVAAATKGLEVAS